MSASHHTKSAGLGLLVAPSLTAVGSSPLTCSCGLPAAHCCWWPHDSVLFCGAALVCVWQQLNCAELAAAGIPGKVWALQNGSFSRKAEDVKGLVLRLIRVASRAAACWLAEWCID